MNRAVICIFLFLMTLRTTHGISPMDFAVLNPFSSFLSLSFAPPPAPPDTICKGDTLSLNAYHPLASSYSWAPNYNISSTTSATPYVFPQVTTAYVVNVNGLSNNLIFNGDFTFGNVGFTSSYTYTTNLWPEATYCIGTNPQTFHTGFAPCGDHTTGTGNMMVVNGAGAPNTIIWQQTIPVVPNTNYQFSCWLASVHISSPAQLQFFVNNVQIGPVFTATPINCNWNMFFNQWFSGTATSAVISIRNQNTSLAGNDFAIDDLWFAQVVQITDTHLVVVEDPVIDLGNDTAACPGDSVLLDAGSAFSQYLWSTGDLTPQTHVTAGNTAWVRVTTDHGCKASDTLMVNTLPLPQITTTNDSICGGDTATLTAACPSAATYLWSNGSGNASVLVQPSVTTPYTVVVTDTMGCTDSAIATVYLLPNPTVQVSPDVTICRGTQTTLTASGGTGFLWHPGGQNTASITVSPQNPSTVYQVIVSDQYLCRDSGEVTVFTVPYPNILINGPLDTLCIGQPATITASGGDAYQWNTGDLDASITVTPPGNTTYSVTVSNLSGGIRCETDAQYLLMVKPCNTIYIPNAISLSGINNVFRPEGEMIYAEAYRLMIFNRWGQLLFETDDFLQGWDGTFRGKTVEEGVYVYDIMVNSGYGTPWRRRGTVTVVR